MTLNQLTKIPNCAKTTISNNHIASIILMLISMASTALIYHCFLRHTNTVMAGSSPGSSLGRSWSLIDVSRASQTPSAVLSASATDVRVQPGTSTSIRSSGNTETSTLRAAARDTTVSEEQGLALLGDDAAYGEPDGTGGISVDNSILDYDSEGSDQASHTTSGTEMHLLSATMETDSEVVPDDPLTRCIINVVLLGSPADRTPL
jgi:hypothetical protein